MTSKYTIVSYLYNLRKKFRGLEFANFYRDNRRRVYRCENLRTPQLIYIEADKNRIYYYCMMRATFVSH